MARNRKASTPTTETDNDPFNVDRTPDDHTQENNTMSDILIEDVPVKSKPLIYADHVSALQDAGEGKMVTITVPETEAQKHKRYFSNAAHAVERTARTELEQRNDDGTVTFKFSLANRQKRARKHSTENAAAPENTENTENPENTENTENTEAGESATVADEAPGE